MRTDLAFDKICDITPIVCDIIDKANTDEELRKVLFEGLKQKDVKRTTQIRYLAQILKKCRDEVFEILGIVYNKSVDDVKEQDFISETVPQIVDLWNNPEIQRLFFSSSKTTQADETVEEKAADVSSPISESTAEETEEQPAVVSGLYANF